MIAYRNAGTARRTLQRAACKTTKWDCFSFIIYRENRWLWRFRKQKTPGFAWIWYCNLHSVNLIGLFHFISMLSTWLYIRLVNCWNFKCIFPLWNFFWFQFSMVPIRYRLATVGVYTNDQPSIPSLIIILKSFFLPLWSK